MKTSIIFIIKNYISSILNINSNKVNKSHIVNLYSAADTLTVISATKGTNYTINSSAVVRFGNILRAHYDVKRSSNSGTGNIDNELIVTLKVAKPVGYNTYWTGSGQTAGTGPVTTNYANIRHDDNYIYIDIYLTATHSAVSSITGYVLIPMALDISAY